ncbi:MAG TPA: hypothetical protein RMH99_26625 [Sandaracinaceae bacterium LLY-WYZ-13_1]|nr:hypothetical protein [Sandaracinaceae bacterium LLY-WYZ-13_1]
MNGRRGEARASTGRGRPGRWIGALGVAAWLLAAASPAAAQTTRPSAPPAGPAAPSGLAAHAAPGSHLSRADDGRIRRAWGLSIPVEGVDAGARARAFVARYRAELALAPGARLALSRVLEAHGRTVVRLSRIAAGGPVVGGSVVVRLGGPDRDVVDYVSLAGVALPASGAPRRIGARGAARAALAADERALTVRAASLAWGGALIPVWVVDAAGPRRSRRRRVIVDGRDGATLAARPLQLDATGRVYERDPTSDEGETTDVELPSLTSRERLTGRHFRVESCNAGERGCDPTQLAEADAAGDFLYEPSEPDFEDPFVEVHAYYHANRVASYFREAHDFTWTCDASSVMRVFVNFTERAMQPFDNAAYSPSSGSECGFMLFGQGSERDFAYDADVVYHEFGHAMVDGTAGLGFFVVDPLGVSYEPGAINEGTADYFAATLSGDPRMAEYFMGSGAGAGEGALRRLDNDLVCPNDLVGESHFDGRIWAALGWDLREAIGVEKTDALFFATVSALDMVPSLADATETLYATADAMLADGALTPDDRAAVDEAVAGRGLEGCERVAPLDDGTPRLAYSGQPELTGTAGGSIAPVHYSIEIPPDATALRLRIERLSFSGEYRIFTREGAPIRFVASRRPPVLASGEHAPDDDGLVVIDRSSEPPLPRCETLYVAVVTEDLRTAGAALYQVSAELERSGLDEPCGAPDAGTAPSGDGGVPDGGSDGSEPGGGGCGCRAAPASGGGAPALLGLALAVLASRLRRGRGGAAGRRAAGACRRRRSPPPPGSRPRWR